MISNERWNEMIELFKKKEINLYAPVNGHMIRLEEVSDHVFASHMMGDGVAFKLEDNTVCAPCDGKVTFIPETLHAFGMKAYNGAEILVHIGLDTVNLKGQGFQKLVNQGDRVRKGTPIIRLNITFMKEKKLDLTTPMVITNSTDYDLTVVSYGQVRKGESQIICLRK